MPLCLRPACIERAEPRRVLWHVVDSGQSDWLDPRPPERQQEALEAHVPVLRDPLGVPAAHVLAQEQRHGVGGVGEADGVGVRERCQLLHGGEHRAWDKQHGHSVVVLDMENGRLEQAVLPLALWRLHILSRELLKVASVEVRVGVRHGDQDLGRVLPLILNIVHEPLEGPCHVASLPWRVVRQVLWMVRCKELLEAPRKLCLHVQRLGPGLGVPLLHGEEHADLRAGDAALADRL
mmetsp:Transcript_64132/g.187664  ORF Transcript_64132/g.187664 Transcript_64132/m.187664 type:complete len:236 (+) Transcript_64132:681-1388(+)